MKILYAMLAVLTSFCTVQAILDGRTTPTTIDYHYTFSNFEWARGHVAFKDGFDIPAAGTVLLDIYEPVQGLINFNGGTAFLQGDLEMGSLGNIVGPGYISAQGIRELLLSSDLILGTSLTSFFLTGNELKIRGKNKIRIFLSAGGNAFLNLIGAFRVHFINVSINQLSNDRFITDFSGPSRLTLQDCDLIATRDVSFNSELVRLIGENRLTTRYDSIVDFVQRVFMTNDASLHLSNGAVVTFNDFDMNVRAVLSCENAVVDYTPTVTNDISISGLGFSSGEFLFSGRSILRSSTGNKLYSLPGAALNFLPGARLVID